MSSAQETILQAVRDLLVAVGGTTAAKVLVAGTKGPRPAKPYFTVRVTAAKAGDLGPAERIDGLNGSIPRARMKEQREATVSIQGFGTGAQDVLDTFALNIDSPASLSAQGTTKVACMVMSGPSDMSEVVDTAEEPRTLLELRVRYGWQGDPANQVAVVTATIDADGIRYTGDADPLSIDYVYP